MPNMRKIISAHNSIILREEHVKEAEKKTQQPAEQQVEEPKKRGRKRKKEKNNQLQLQGQWGDMSPGGTVPHRQTGLQCRSRRSKWQQGVLYRVTRQHI